MIYNKDGTQLLGAYDYTGGSVGISYDVYGIEVFPEKHTPDVKLVGVYETLSPAPNPWTQGGAVYGNKLVVAQASTSTLATLGFYDLTTGQKLGQSNLSGNSVVYHGNTVTFAPNLHSGNFSFPYVFISEYYGNGTIGVFNVTESNGTYSATEVQTIDFSGISGDLIGYGYHDFMIDFSAGLLFVVRYNTAGTFQAEVGNTTIISVFSLPNITGNNVVLTASDVISHHEIPTLIYGRQETVYHLGFAYILAGGSGSAKIYIVDCDSWTLYDTVDLSSVISGEPETLYFKDGYMYVINGNGNVYQFSY